MARAALAEADENPAFEIRDLLLLRPLQVADDGARDVEVELEPDAEGYRFHVRSARAAGPPTTPAVPIEARSDATLTPSADDSPHDASGASTVHAEARIVMRTPRAAPALSIAEISARCRTARSASGSRRLESAQESLVRFGPRWRTLREVRLGEGEALADLELAPEFAGDLEHYGIHPALLDIAMTCALELPEIQQAEVGHDPSDTDRLWVPVSFSSIRVHGRMPSRVWSWVRARAAERGSDALASFDVVIADAHGRVCLEIDELSMRRMAPDLGMSEATGAKDLSPARAPLASDAPRDVHAASPGLAELRRNLARGISPAAGVEALQRILGSTRLPQIVATSLDLEGLRAQADARAALAEITRDTTLEIESDEEPEAESSDAIERTLAGFWRELLGVRKVGVRDNFFDLGGHSLIAVRLFARIKRTYRVEFPISLLFEAPTIERCAAAIRQALQAQGTADVETDVRAPRVAVRESRYTHLVPMHPGQGGPKTPFILVAGMFGNVLNLRHLAHLLGNERRFYGLQALGLYGAHKPHETFEEMAEAYLAEVRDVQPHGPYLLGGFSGGGITAYEMALRLTAEGEEVALLAMLDTGLPHSPELKAADRARIHWDRIRRRGPAYVTEWAKSRWRWERAQRKRNGHDGAAAMPSEFRSEEIGDAFRRALTRYDIPHYSGVVTLFRPKLDVAHVLGPGRMTNERREFLFHDNGWGQYAARVDVHEVPGDHDSIVLEPNVRVLAAKLRKCIDAVESATLHHASATNSAPVAINGRQGA
jgi:thioesterase domain-containing protein/acyl carrier protein